ncbi:hypothetical protein, variant [Aphanomyces invadans]|uniref:mRNA export factor GLE1 n=1 Tax=Aphanomyces invadans TaxID=157072 RepID=A0A024U423_9STRA|nr:hypothetical protein, variant [Aphanomyces invadans]ETW00358.1 hypothetical protein, variant [Aphanomyces invadans]|eukprot:XP_008870493.1 hypothetical protein, variant [Aphanomyces invadans]
MGRVAAPGWSDDGDDVCVSKVHGHRGTSYPRDTPASLLSPRFADSKRCDVYKHEVSYVDNLMTSLQLVVLNCEQCALQNTKRNPHMPEKVGAHQGDLARTLVSDASAITRSYSSLQKCAEVELEKVKRERADKFSVISQNVKRLEIQIKAAAPPPKPAAVVTTPEVKPAVAEEPPSPPRTPPATPLASSPAPSIPPTTVTSLAPKIVPEKPQEVARPASPELYIVTAKGRMENLTTLEASIVPFADNQDPNVKRIRVLLKKKLGEACNQIANSLSSIRLVVDKIRQAFGEAKAAGEIYFNFALNFVASKMAAQVRVLAEVSSCFPIANVVAMCCVHTPELTDIFLAHMHTICPYTIPLVPVRTEGQTDDEYRVSIGMERDEAKGTFEAFEKYTQRMAMAVALVMAVMQVRRSIACFNVCSRNMVDPPV